MKVSERGIDLIKGFESFRAEAYLCPAGVWTIGYGTTAGIVPGMTITEPQATERLKKDVQPIESMLNGLGIWVNQNQFDALASFVYNVGPGAFKSSTLLKLIRQDVNSPSIRDEFNKWVHGGGRVLPGLVTRREQESNLYFA